MRRQLFLVVLLALCATALAACGGSSSSSTPTPVPPAVTPTPVKVGGDVYVFGNARVAVVDSESGTVVQTITSGVEGITAWDDAAVSPDGRTLFVSAHNNDEVLAFDTVKRALIKAIPVGKNPVHLSIVNNGKEVWSHSDAEGTFYVIDTASLTVIDKVDASTTHSGHGALLATPSLGAKYYATNVNSPAIFEIDAATRKVTKTISLCKGSDGTGGTHGLAYSAASQEIYVQCSGSLQKVATVRPADDSVGPYIDSTGDIYTPADASAAVVANSGTNTLDILDATPNSVRFDAVPIPNRAASAYFATVGGKLLAFVADLKAPDVEVVDMAAKRVSTTIPGAPLPGQGPDTIVPRSSAIGGGFYYTIVRTTGAVNIIDVQTQKLTHSLSVDGAYVVAFVGHPS